MLLLISQKYIGLEGACTTAKSDVNVKIHIEISTTIDKIFDKFFFVF